MTIASGTKLKRSSPEAEGIASAAVLNFVHAVEEHDHPLDAVQSFMLLRHGNVAAEGWWAPYGPDDPHALYSVSKSFTATARPMACSPWTTPFCRSSPTTCLPTPPST